MPAKLQGADPQAINSSLVCSAGSRFVLSAHRANFSMRLPFRMPLQPSGAQLSSVLLLAKRGVTVHIPRRSPKDSAVIPPAFAPPPPRPASRHSSRLARSAVLRSVSNLCPVRTAPEYTARSPPALAAPSCLPSLSLSIVALYHQL